MWTIRFTLLKTTQKLLVARMAPLLNALLVVSSLQLFARRFAQTGISHCAMIYYIPLPHWHSWFDVFFVTGDRELASGNLNPSSC